jgi:hypothetical protein
MQIFSPKHSIVPTAVVFLAKVSWEHPVFMSLICYICSFIIACDRLNYLILNRVSGCSDGRFITSTLFFVCECLKPWFCFIFIIYSVSQTNGDPNIYIWIYLFYTKAILYLCNYSNSILDSYFMSRIDMLRHWSLRAVLIFSVFYLLFLCCKPWSNLAIRV